MIDTCKELRAKEIVINTLTPPPSKILQDFVA